MKNEQRYIKETGNKDNLEGAVAAAKTQVREIEAEAEKEAREAQQLEQELLEAQRAEQQRKEAEDKGQETKENIDRVAGG